MNSINAAGAFSIVGGKLQFSPGVLFDHLTASETATVTVGYTVQDALSSASSSTLTLTVQGADDKPLTVADTGDVVERQYATGTLLANDSDVDTGDTLRITALANGVGTVPVGAGGVVIGGAYGVINVLQDGSYTYYGNGEGIAVGSSVVDTFTYTVSDAFGGSSTATLSMTVTGSPTGDGGANVIIGSAAADTLDGRAGADRITGGGGADTLIGGAGADRFIYTAAGDSTAVAPDLITDFQSGVDVIDLSAVDGGGAAIAFDGTDSYVAFGVPTASGYPNLIKVQGVVRISDLALSAGTGVAFYGSSGSDTLVGGAQGDLLLGGGGADVLTGGAGADIFYYGAAADSAVLSPDRITDFQSGVDRIDLRSVHTSAADTYSFRVQGADTLLSLDLGGDGVVDMLITLANTASLKASDILF